MWLLIHFVFRLLLLDPIQHPLGKFASYWWLSTLLPLVDNIKGEQKDKG